MPTVRTLSTVTARLEAWFRAEEQLAQVYRDQHDPYMSCSQGTQRGEFGSYLISPLNHCYHAQRTLSNWMGSMMMGKAVLPWFFFPQDDILDFPVHFKMVMDAQV